MQEVVALYGQAQGWQLGRRTVLVEGVTDERLFQLARDLELRVTGRDLFAHGLAVVAAGMGDDGGARGVVRELSALRCMGRTSLMPDGRLRYRFIGLLDNDDAGRRAAAGARNLDAGIVEYKDVFRLRPFMPREGGLDPGAMKRSFRVRNGGYEDLNWELEDLVAGDLVESFIEEYVDVLRGSQTVGGLIHRSFTRDGKQKLHRYIREYAIQRDLGRVADVIRSIRYYFGLPGT